MAAPVDLRLVCIGCGETASAGAKGWRAHLTGDEEDRVAIYCPDCAASEFSDDDAPP